MIKTILKQLGKFLSTFLHNTVVLVLTSIVGAPVLVSWVTGTLDILIETVKSPTPLWASISLVLLCCGYIYSQNIKSSAKIIKTPLLISTKNNYDIKTKLESLKERILTIVAVNKLLRDSQVADVAKISEQLATFHLNELKELGLVGSQFTLDEYSYEGKAWSVNQQGLKYLHHYGFI
jgi:hypothetical protein